jgi:hypothetical protein
MKTCIHLKADLERNSLNFTGAKNVRSKGVENKLQIADITQQFWHIRQKLTVVVPFLG